MLDSSVSSSTNPVTKLFNSTMTASVVIPNGTTIAGLFLNSPQGITLDGYGNIYIADTGNNRIIQAHQYSANYSQNVVYVPSTTTFGGVALSGPTGLTVDAAGDLFIADTKNNRIVEYSVTGVASVISAGGITLKAPNGISVLPSGALVVTDQNNIASFIDNGVGTKLTFNTSTATALTPGTAAGVALDLFGNIYVPDSKNSQVVELNVNSPATAPVFPSTNVGSTSADSDLAIYNSGVSALTFSVAPSLASTTNFAIDTATTTCNNGAPRSLRAGIVCWQSSSNHRSSVYSAQRRR